MPQDDTETPTTSPPMLVEAPPHSATEDSAASEDSASGDAAAINAALDHRLAPRDGCPERLLRAMRYALLGPGKRLRPRLVLMASRASGGELARALPAACAVEMIHAYSLVHDDLPAMDDDDLRRGRPTVHKQFDEATAILVGDALQALALEILATETEPPQIGARCTAELAQAAGPAALVGGQADDLAATGASLDDLRAIHRRKTGALITCSLRLGALVAGATDDLLTAFTTYGEALGLAFQVTDDLLDAAGDEAAVGKRVGKDHERGKLTYPRLLGIDASRDYATELIDQAISAIAVLDERGEPLRRLARQILVRNH